MLHAGHKPLVSIVILNYNGLEFVENCLRSIWNTGYSDFEVIFVDNASRDGSLEYVREKFGEKSCLKIIANDKNYGFAEGNNTGIRYAKGNYVVFLNIDTEVDPNWLTGLVKVMESDRTIAAAQSKLLLMNDHKRFDSAGDLVDFYGVTSTRGVGEEDRGQYDRVEEVFSARGAAMIVRKASFFDVGLFDSNFFMQLDDVDFCWRLRLAGHRIVFVPTSIVYHKAGALAKKQPTLMFFHYQKNGIAMMIKNYSVKNLVRYLPSRIAVDLLHAIAESRVHIVIRGILWNLKNLRTVWRKRLRVQRYVRKVSDSQVMRHMVKTSLLQQATWRLRNHAFIQRSSEA